MTQKLPETDRLVPPVVRAEARLAATAGAVRWFLLDHGRAGDAHHGHHGRLVRHCARRVRDGPGAHRVHPFRCVRDEGPGWLPHEADAGAALREVDGPAVLQCGQPVRLPQAWAAGAPGARGVRLSRAAPAAGLRVDLRPPVHVGGWLGRGVRRLRGSRSRGCRAARRGRGLFLNGPAGQPLQRLRRKRERRPTNASGRNSGDRG